MSILAQSLKRIYTTGKPIKLTKDDIKKRVVDGKITEDEYEYITGERYSQVITNASYGVATSSVLGLVKYGSEITSF